MDARLLATPCTIVSVAAGTADVYGDDTEATTSTATTCYLEQVKSQELGGKAVEESTWLVVLPGGVSLRGTDRLTIGGSMYALAGDPWPVVRPSTGLVDHVEASVVRVA